MQTFLPHPSFEDSAKALDYRRLGKQRVEAWQILQTLAGLSKGWANHPASIMWKDHPLALCDYGIAMCVEWVRRGYSDSMATKFAHIREGLRELHSGPWMPGFLGCDAFHASHRRSLSEKDFNHYGPQWKDIPATGYLWPKWSGKAWELWHIDRSTRYVVLTLDRPLTQ